MNNDQQPSPLYDSCDDSSSSSDDFSDSNKYNNFFKIFLKLNKFNFVMQQKDQDRRINRMMNVSN